MSKLQILYSKEIAKELGKIAIYLPGEPIEVGDIITFPNSRRSFLNKPRPLGSFRKVSSLKYLGVEFQKSNYSKQKNTYRYSSTENVSISSDTIIKGDLGISSLPSLDSNIKMKFGKEGAIYFLAKDCSKTQIDNLYALENKITVANNRGILWEESFLVTSVTKAKRAFIAQSHSKSSQLYLKGEMDGINYGNINTDLNTEFSVSKHQGDIFIKDWSTNVNVFMDVVRFEVDVFSEKARNFNSKIKKVKSKASLRFEPVCIGELLIN
jgi:hypothetical protein